MTACRIDKIILERKMDTTPASGQAPVTTAPGKGNRWFVMRDLSRSNAKLPAWEMLRDKHIRHFTPLVWRMMSVGGKRKPRQVPYIQDLVFAYGTRGELDPLVERVRTFQYRYLRHTWREPMTVPDLEMERFIRAVESTHSPRYYTPEEVTPEMRNRPVCIVGGPLDGYTGTLVTVRGSKRKRLLVEIPMLLAAAVEVEPEYIKLL